MKWFNQLKIGLKIIIVLFLMLLVFFSIMGTLSYNSAKTSVEVMVETSLTEKAQDNALVIETIVKSELSKLEEVANMEVMMTMDWISQISFLSPYKNRTDFYDLFVIDLDGESRSTNTINANLKNESYFINAVNGKSSISNPYMSKLYNKMVNVYSVPIYNDNGEVVGVLGATVNYEIFGEIVSSLKVGENGYSFIINDEGTTVGHFDSTFITNFNNDFDNLKKDKTLKDLTNLERKLIDEGTVYGAYAYKEKTETGKSLKTIDYKMAGHVIEGTDWYLVVNAPVEEMLAEAYSLRNTFITFIVIFILIGSTVGFIVINILVVKPISRMVHITDRLKVGDTELELEVKSGDEIGVLTDSLKSVLENTKLQTQVLDALAKGDIEAYKEIDVRSEKDIQSKSLIRIGETLNRLMEEIDGLTNAAVEGNMKKRGIPENFEGGYFKLVEGINNTLDAAIKPVEEGIDVLEKVSNGDFKVIFENEYKGDHQRLRVAIEKTVNNLSVYITEVSNLLTNLADGEFDIEIENNYIGDFEPIQIALEKIIRNLNVMFHDFTTASEKVASGSSQVFSSSQAISAGAAEQASSVEELTASVSEIARMTKNNADNSNLANELIRDAMEQANAGDRQMEKMLEAMEEIYKASEDIQRVLKVIDNLAFQTNILALNASVEAARAGQHGKGFQVVAQSVRNLSNKSADNAKETAALIQTSINKAKNGTEMAGQTAKALKAIIEKVSKTVSLVDDITKSSNEQATGVTQVDQGLVEISKVVQSNSAISEETASASEELSNQASRLREQIEKIHLKEIEDEIEDENFDEE